MKSLLLPSLTSVLAAAALLGLPIAGAAAATFTVIHTFYPLGDGNTPVSALAQGSDGLLYGTATVGGPYSNGTLYRLAADGTNFAVLNSFPGVNAGSQPRGGLVQARDGNFYGTTYRGGSSNEGTLFQLTPAGILTYIAAFTEGATPGASPAGTLVEARDGSLHGTAQYGGLNNFGTIYRFAPPSGQPTVEATVAGGLGGTYPQSDLCLASDGYFYGTTTLGGQYNNGIFFRVEANGGYTALYNFGSGVDGAMPMRGVVQGSDGVFYGTTRAGGVYGAGTVYRMIVSGNSAVPAVLHSFPPTSAEGSTPLDRPVFASDGSLYGTTTAGGIYNSGCVYRVPTGGGYATVYSFTNTGDGGSPVGGMIQANDGRLYGTTAPVNGEAGTVFRLDIGLPLPAPAPLMLLTGSSAVGGTVLIQGSHFVGATAVNFAANNQTVAAASFRVLSDTVISVVVPTGAITGTVSITVNGQTVAVPGTLVVTSTHPPFFRGEIALSGSVNYLEFPDGNIFGYYTFLSDSRFIYHFDLGFEYVIDANDGAGGVYFYDFTSNSFFYTSPDFPFPYLYDFGSNAFLYYFPDMNNPGHYISNPRYFYSFGTGQIITK